MSLSSIVDAVLQRTAQTERVTCTVSGESGSGKTTLALRLVEQLAGHGLGSVVLHQDDYFRLAPRANDSKRMADLSWVGLDEVRLDLLERHLRAFADGATEIVRPRLNRDADRFDSETLAIGDALVLVVEGTYVARLEPVDLRVFIDLDYRQTEQWRRLRARDPIDELTDRVLAIEHELIRPDLELADIVFLPIRPT